MTFDPLVEERMAGGVIVGRASNGNPRIVPRGGAAEVEYDRASSMADYLVKDIIGIKRWEERLLAEALGRFPDLAALAAVEGYNTGLGHVQPILSPEENKASGRRLDDVIERAFDRIGLHEKADAGTVAHAATEPGFTGVVADFAKASVEAIQELTAALEIVATEVFVASDETRSAGTFDHGYYIADQRLAAELSEDFTAKLGFTVDLTGALIGDKKTGKNVHVGEFEVQLGGTYANGEVYLGPPLANTDLNRGAFQPDWLDQRLTLEEFFGGPVNRTTGLLVHASMTGAPKPRVLPMNLERGRRLGLMAAAVRDARNEMDKVGIPKPIPMNVISKRSMEDQIEFLLQVVDSGDLDKEDFREEALILYRRFKHVWPATLNDEVKRRLT